jgi:hypothetical protein
MFAFQAYITNYCFVLHVAFISTSAPQWPLFFFLLGVFSTGFHFLWLLGGNHILSFFFIYISPIKTFHKTDFTLLWRWCTCLSIPSFQMVSQPWKRANQNSATRLSLSALLHPLTAPVFTQARQQLLCTLLFVIHC